MEAEVHASRGGAREVHRLACFSLNLFIAHALRGDVHPVAAHPAHDDDVEDAPKHRVFPENIDCKF